MTDKTFAAEKAARLASRRVRHIEAALAAGQHRTWDGSDLRRLLREAQIEAGCSQHYSMR